MTQDVLRPQGGPPPVNPAAFAFPAVQPPGDPDATIVIGRHRADGSRTPTPGRRRWFVGRVAAATVARFRRAGR